MQDTEELRYGLMNDYMFRATMQSNEKVLKGFVCALLNLEESEIKECVIENPIILGEDIESKDCILDLKLLLNNNERLNIEMQAAKKLEWKERSLLYLCRSFDDIGVGEDYSSLRRTIHIGILNFSLFPDKPEFYAEYLLMNRKNHKIYTDKFSIRVLELTQIENVAFEERKCDLYYWAKLFKAASWEEIAMLAEKNDSIREAAVTMKRLSADEKIKLQCEAREWNERDRVSILHYGIRQGEQNFSALTQYLLADQRIDDLKKAVEDSDFRKELYEEYKIR